MTATLFIDSAYDSCSVGLYIGSQDGFVSQLKEMRYGQAEVIMPMIEAVLSQVDMKAADLSQIVVNVGPGRFTGIRLAIAAAKALALPFDTPLLGMTGTQCYAYRYFRDNPGKQGCVVALASGRGNYFVQYLSKAFKKESEIKDISPDEIRNFCNDYGGDISVVTDDASPLQLSEAVEMAVLHPVDMKDLWIFRSENALPFSSVSPLYVRPPDVSAPKR